MGSLSDTHPASPTVVAGLLHSIGNIPQESYDSCRSVVTNNQSAESLRLPATRTVPERVPVLKRHQRTHSNAVAETTDEPLMLKRCRRDQAVVPCSFGATTVSLSSTTATPSLFPSDALAIPQLQRICLNTTSGVYETPTKQYYGFEATASKTDGDNCSQNYKKEYTTIDNDTQIKEPTVVDSGIDEACSSLLKPQGIIRGLGVGAVPILYQRSLATSQCLQRRRRDSVASSGTCFSSTSLLTVFNNTGCSLFSGGLALRSSRTATVDGLYERLQEKKRQRETECVWKGIVENTNSYVSRTASDLRARLWQPLGWTAHDVVKQHERGNAQGHQACFLHEDQFSRLPLNSCLKYDTTSSAHEELD